MSCPVLQLGPKGEAVSQHNVDVVREIYEAFDAGDIAGVVARMRPDIVWNEAENYPYADGNPYRGTTSVMEVMGRIAAEWDGFTIVRHKLLDAGEWVVMLGRYRGTYRETGRAQNSQVVHVWRIADGKIVTFQQYVDTLQVARVIARA